MTDKIIIYVVAFLASWKLCELVKRFLDYFIINFEEEK